MKLPKEFTLAEIAALVGGVVDGPHDTRVSSVALSPLSAGQGDLALVFDGKFLKRIGEVKATAVVVPAGVEAPLPSIKVARPLLALRSMLAAVAPGRFYPEPGIHPTASVHSTASIGEGAAVGANAVVGPHTTVGRGTVIGANCVLGGRVSVGEDCILNAGSLVADYVQIGNRVILQQGANVGCDGFGYVTERPSNMELRLSGVSELSDEPNPHLKIPQIGNVIIEDDVEIGANTTIARATMGSTVIGAGSKLDNLVMIAHNVRLGREVLIVAQTAVAGSTVVGDRAVLSGHVAVSDHLKIGKDAIIEGKAGVMRDIPERDVQVGIPAVPRREHMEQLVHVKRLPKMADEIRDLKKRIAQLETMLGAKELVADKCK